MAVAKNNGDIISFFKRKDYIMVNNALGNGSFGKTVVLKDPYIDELFVAKKYEPEYEEIKEEFYKNFLDEIKILHKLNHPNIVRVFGYYPYEESFTGYILMEFIDGTDIGAYIKNYSEFDTIIFDKPTPNDLFIQLINAFCYIENNNIIHRDIREGNILIDATGQVKVIDFGIGKMFNPANNQDSLVAQINRAGSDTLPQEYYSGEYTSLTDMFYLAELFNRLMATADHPNEMSFSYQNIVEKMMKKHPAERYKSFNEIKEAIDKHDFINLNISQADKSIYQAFSHRLYSAILKYSSEPKFVNNTDDFIRRMKKALQNNAFEDTIQNNADVISCVVLCGYSYDSREDIPCKVVKEFLTWFEKATKQSQELILANIISKLSTIKYEEPDPDLPF